jgi:hypothetical protein
MGSGIIFEEFSAPLNSGSAADPLRGLTPHILMVTDGRARFMPAGVPVVNDRSKGRRRDERTK